MEVNAEIGSDPIENVYSNVVGPGFLVFRLFHNVLFNVFFTDSGLQILLPFLQPKLTPSS
jgi:hypothetical protein